MQFVPGISSAQTMPAAPAPTAAGRKPSLWILDSWRDLVLYVCTPLLLVPMFIAAQGFWSAEDIYLFVAAFGAMGHHLPGMIRSVRRPRALSAFPMAFHLCADFFGRRLRGVFRVEPDGNCARGVYLGRLAWNDANVRILPDL